MNVWKFAIVFVTVLGVLLGLPLVWWLGGLPGLRWIVVVALISTAAFLVAAPFAALGAAKQALEEFQSRPLLVELNPLWGSLDFAIHRLDRETIADTEMTWGDFEEPSGTKVPVFISLSWEKETNRAVGPWWASASPRELVGLKYKVHETYDRLEREAANAMHTEATMRSGMRRGVQRHQAGVMDAYDSETLPEGEEFGDVFANIEEQYRKDPDADPTDAAGGHARPDTPDPDQDAAEDDAGALPPGETPEEPPAAPDGGRSE
ncbi:hypothetical protein L593_13695 [Salinarchaeum sp. Harcht-Bsk1]|uniref:hypothetical protein n=1 Tax=Salinarchaeum sp. Harcht-Bsk1 TaxID=1333523 RepID=UPI00034229D7|nr:hypothetical protein [Salinarchaeum sp. Harcht-Bsk1]AGN02678.1 hypothetical protein L593_13695 [Salinarchaeum sp. Harcht-Bsk1]